MSGIIGGEFGTVPPAGALEELSGDEPRSTWRQRDGTSGLVIEYHGADERAASTWEDGNRAGVVDGVVTNLDGLGWTTGELFERLLRRPAETARAIEGGFVIGCYDSSADRHLVVTDKLGTRPLFYVDEQPPRYASSVPALLPYCDEVTMDSQAVSDMLLMGNLWGNHTLVDEIRSVRPATVLDSSGAEWTAQRYWKPDYTEEEPGEQYITELVSRYRQAVDRTRQTLPPEAGIWLSGGLDSRTTASALVRGSRDVPEIKAYTYDANPPTSDNPRIAREVAHSLDIEHENVPLTAQTVGDNFDRIIESTDGMLMWATTTNLSATYEINSPPPVLMEGMQGALVGDHLYRYHLSAFSSAVESQLSSEAAASPSEVRSLLDERVDPLETFREEAKRCAQSTTRETVLDVHFQNYYSRLAMPSNRLMRDRTGTRVIHADGDYLEWCAKLPRRYRKGAFRMKGLLDQPIPYEPTRAKLALIRSIDPELAAITYERSKVKPSWPYEAHVLGFIGNVLFNRLRSNPTYGNGQLADFWIRDTETPVHDRVTRLTDDACSRGIFNADNVRDVYVQHMEGANNSQMLSRITTLEHWFQKYLD